MSLSLTALDSNGREHTSRLVPVEGATYEAQVAGVSFSVSRESAAPQGFPGCHLWTLRLRRDRVPSGAAWNFNELRIAEIPLHPRTEAVHAGGWQCWSESPLVGASGTLRGEAFPERSLFGDSDLYRTPERVGLAHSWSASYTCIKGSARNAFFAALDEDLFFTRFEFDLSLCRFSIALDTAGAAFEHMRSSADGEGPFLQLGAWICAGEESADFPPLGDLASRWMALVRKYERVVRVLPEADQAPRRSPIRGYTSWYLHYNAITEDVLARNLAQVAKETGMSVFQVDDGYQLQIGDWLHPAPGFPRGVSGIAAQAKAYGLAAGIWCAPFIAAENSRLMGEHPEWLLKDATGQPVLCGNHPLWGGRFFALDTENPAVLAYVEDVLSTAFNEWGFTFLKADFLYAAARIPAGGLTRAQRSARAHEFLYRVCVKHGAKLLSCGAVLSSAAMRCDYSRIGPDAGESWENQEFGTQPSREKVSTRASLVNAVSRSFLGGAAFGNDPDVFFLRSDRLSLTDQEKETLATVNFALGDLVFTSDEVGGWSVAARALHTRLAGDFDARARGDATGKRRVEAVQVPEGAGPEGALSVTFTSGETLVMNFDEVPLALADGVVVESHGCVTWSPSFHLPSVR